MFTILILY